MSERKKTARTRILAAGTILLLLPIAPANTAQSVLPVQLNEACARGGCCFSPGSICGQGGADIEFHRYFAGSGC